jgi:hypothetical protein
MRKSLLSFLVLFLGATYAFAQNSNVTFSVDMSQYSGSTANGVFVNGTFNNWCGSCNPLTDANGDGVWEVTLPLTNGVIEYKFTVDGWNAQESLMAGMSCVLTTGAFTNRVFTVAGNATLPTVCWNSCVACGASQNSNVTFSVDMSQYSGSTANGVFVNGTFNSWCGSCNALTDANADGIWEGTFSIPNGVIEYKFTVDGWNDQENLMVGMPCVLTTGNFTNRVLTVAGNATLPTVCWNSCAACGGGGMSGDSINITFKVNTALITVDPNGLFLAGGGVFGSPGDNPMSDANGDGTWEITVRMPKGGMFDYTFTNGNCPNWGCKENIAGLPCAVAPFNDRHFHGAWADTTVLACFGACESNGSCPTPPTMVNVTFQVDMSAETVSGGVFIGGNFEGWSGNLALTDADNDQVWTGNASIASGSAIEWKFINGAGWATPEQFDGADSACTITVGQFINRYATIGSADTTLPAFLFNSCDFTSNTEEVLKNNALFEIQPTLASDFSLIYFNEKVVVANKTIRVFNTMGQSVQNVTIGEGAQYHLNTSNFANGLYFVVVESEGFAQTARIVVSH